MTVPDNQEATINSDKSSALTSASVDGDGSVDDNAASGHDESEKLQKLVAEYETRINELAEVISRVRHEINNPLTGVLGQAQLLLREELDEKTRKRVQTIEALAIRLRDIVGQLRQVQKVSRP